MGSLTSRPSVPKVSRASTPVAQAVVSAPDSAAQDIDLASSADQTKTQARTQSLLTRGRSRFGTIRTGFRGLLGAENDVRQRKTLLGE